MLCFVILIKNLNNAIIYNYLHENNLFNKKKNKHNKYVLSLLEERYCVAILKLNKNLKSQRKILCITNHRTSVTNNYTEYPRL